MFDLSSLFDDSKNTDQRLSRIEHKLDAIITYLGIEDSYETMLTKKASAEVVAFVREGRELEAIKQYRKETGASLRQALTAIKVLGTMPLLEEEN